MASPAISKRSSSSVALMLVLFSMVRVTFRKKPRRPLLPLGCSTISDGSTFETVVTISLSVFSLSESVNISLGGRVVYLQQRSGLIFISCNIRILYQALANSFEGCFTLFCTITGSSFFTGTICSFFSFRLIILLFSNYCIAWFLGSFRFIFFSDQQ